MNEHERTYVRFRQALRMGKRHLFRGEWLTVPEIAVRTGLAVRTVYARLQKDVALDTAKMRGGSRPRLYAFRGAMMTCNEIAVVLGIGDQAVRDRAIGNRIPDNEEMRELRRVQNNAALLTFDGITDTVAGWSRRTGWHYSTIFIRRFYRGWTPEQTLTTPPRPAWANSLPRRNRTAIRRIARAIMRDRNTSIIQRIASATQTGGYRQTFDLTRRTGEDSSARDLHHEGTRA